ncbi:MAG: menaquinol-cytochrome c reductase cytochrome b subunit, partial [Acidimicrobiia bacterium]|nr:menaquinol-cytochrome c reductase cytochrome b subunit [Acidimicrobiia bacterium]
MTEIPEHLRKRAEEAKRKAQAKAAGGAAAPAEPA